MLGILVERAWAIEDLLVLLIIVALGARLIDGGDDVVWLAAAILARLGSFCSITAAVTMVTTVIEAAVVVASVVVAMRWAMSSHILVEAHLGFLGVSVLAVMIISPIPVGGLRLNLEQSSQWWSPRMKEVMTSASVILGIEFLISEKRRM